MFTLWLVEMVFGCGATADTGDDSRADTSHDSPADTGTDISTDTSTSTTGRESLGLESDDTLTVEAWAEEALHVGLNEVAFRVSAADGTPLAGRILSQAPLMTVGEAAQSCPHTEPTDAGGGWYESDVVFVTAGTWEDAVTVSDDAGDRTFAFTDLDVLETGLAQAIPVGSGTWVLTVTIPGGPQVGDNPFVLTVHSMAGPLSFSEVAALSVTITPTMPDMGHGSTGNVDPVFTEDGRYEGLLVFSMGGAWEVEFALSDGAGIEAAATFAIDV